MHFTCLTLFNPFSNPGKYIPVIPNLPVRTLNHREVRFVAEFTVSS